MEAESIRMYRTITEEQKILQTIVSTLNETHKKQRYITGSSNSKCFISTYTET
jgi:hypothetical protein